MPDTIPTALITKTYPDVPIANRKWQAWDLPKQKHVKRDMKLKSGNFPFTANGKAHGIGKTNGFVKLIFDAKYGELLGAHMIGPDVTENDSRTWLGARIGSNRTGNLQNNPCTPNPFGSGNGKQQPEHGAKP